MVVMVMPFMLQVDLESWVSKLKLLHNRCEFCLRHMRSNLIVILAVIALYAVMECSAFAADAGSATPVVVELFTSEGCSSCPPADALLRAMDSTLSIPGVHLIVMEEHVDYWDDQGWKDPFSSHEVTLRQVDYTQRLHVREPYTPEMVVDGAYEFTGNDRTRAGEALKKAVTLPTVSVRISSIAVENGKLRAHIEADSVPEKADVMVALVLDHAESQVLRGENGGHHLEHVAVLTNLSKVGKAEKGRPFSKDISLGSKSLTQPCRLIAFLQESGQGKIVGAAVEPVSK